VSADRQPAVWRVPRAAHGYTFSPGSVPALKVAPGDYVVFETLDCFANKLTSPSQSYAREEDLLSLLGAYNPVTGPVHVAGANPGDTLAVRILDVEIGTAAPFAVTNSFGHGSRLVTHDCAGMPPAGSTRICPIRDGQISFPLDGRTLSLPARPMVGTIGTAPAGRDVPSVLYSRDIGGNMDCPRIRAGAEVYLPVNVPGALLYLGDVHALMGDAEITGTALETSADVTVQIGLLPAAEHRLTTPHVDSTAAIGTIGCTAEASLEANLETAMVELQQRLAGQYGLAPVDAYELLGAVAHVNVNQCVPRSWKSVYAGIDRRFLPPYAAPARPGGPAGEDDHAAA
jgi:amidase